jgi:hypothetical protein
VANDIDLDKFYTQAAYSDTSAAFDTGRLDKFYTLALYISVPFVPPPKGGSSGSGGKDKPGKGPKGKDDGYSQGYPGALRAVHARRAHNRFVMPPLVPASLLAGPGTVGVWSGTAWEQKPAKVWTGSAWVQKPVKTWNGSAWV